MVIALGCRFGRLSLWSLMSVNLTFLFFALIVRLARSTDTAFTSINVHSVPLWCWWLLQYSSYATCIEHLPNWQRIYKLSRLISITILINVWLPQAEDFWAVIVIFEKKSLRSKVVFLYVIGQRQVIVTPSPPKVSAVVIPMEVHTHGVVLLQ